MEIIEKADTKEKIAKEALHLFFHNGIKSVSVDDIARHLSMSKKTIYKWYENKDEVVLAAVSGYIGEIQHECEEFTVKAENAIDELFRIMTMMRKIFSAIHPIIFYDLQKFHASSWKKWQDHKNGFMLTHIKQNLIRGVQEGLFRADLDIEVMSRLRLAQVELPFNQLIFPRHEFELQRVQIASLEHFMLGIATLKGHKLINSYKHITEEE